MHCRLAACVSTYVCLPALLCACTSVGMPSVPGVPIAEVVADLQRGTARSFDACTWLPGSAGFSLSSSAPVKVGGQLLLMDHAVQWGAYDLRFGSFRVSRKIPFEQIRSVSLAQKSGQSLIVVEGNDGLFDTFGCDRIGARRGALPAFDPAITSDAYRVLLAQMGL
ncbi:hypothetical protein [Lacisediminimonas sp.]|uniref:hypothetical protein n=1 Tax=Lacisediminimonas sp. TaxID=3060582 RepID=UPI00271F70B8|nr:hypothetical protein [Lacisediminimonas sp.]MDO8299657.1 hypothetical protein [Lacisediminimonas sp.]